MLLYTSVTFHVLSRRSCNGHNNVEPEYISLVVYQVPGIICHLCGHVQGTRYHVSCGGEVVIGGDGPWSTKPRSTPRGEMRTRMRHAQAQGEEKGVGEVGDTQRGWSYEL